ncbi:sugar transferase [Candidatus Pelagibacter sp.]|jgi:sugar transferase EpsL|nr:sugar transferase [Candidatus Pelagibacter sp.]
MYNFFNRLLALLISAILFPVIFFIYFFLLTKIGNPIIFKQKRSGLNGKSFYLYKFRTMQIKKNKKEIKRIYKSTLFLRTSRLDEFPQLFNVIKGDLNFVGPRPLLIEYNKLYNRNQKMRLSVMPGITGWAQVNGDNNISWSKKFKLDIWYVENKSIFLDIKIILLTINFIFKKIIYKKNKEKIIIAKKFNGKN